MSSLREALEGALNQSDAEPVAPDAEVTEQQEPEHVEPVAAAEPNAEAEHKGPARTPDGKFAPKESAEDKVSAEGQPAPEQAAPSRKAPSSWKPAAQEAFLKADRGEPLTPEEIRLLTSEAERRESDFHRGVSEFKSHSERAKAYDQAIAPYQTHLQNLGVDAPTAISALMRADYTLRNSDPVTKAQYFRQLANEYGIDLNQEVPQVDPNTEYLMRQMDALRQQQEMWQNQFRQQEQTKAQHELSQFATAERPHFDAVRNDMADLLETGKAKDLQEAYEMAVWMRSDIRQTLLEQQRSEVQRKAHEAAQAQKAKAAAVSVKGSSPTSAGVQTGSKGSLRDVLAAQFADN